MRQRNAYHLSSYITAISIIWLLSNSSVSWALGDDSQAEFLLFPRAHFDDIRNTPQQLDLKDEELAASISAFYAKNSGRLRFLSEFFLSEGEAEIERLQAGWSLNEKATAWAGRFHSPVGFWNQEYHHGTYLAASVTRPGVVEFEDDGGILPTHLTGLLLEGEKTANGGIWNYSAAIGYGPKITNEGLEAADMANLSVAGHEPTLATMLTYAPNEFGPLRFGVFYLATTFNSEIAAITEVEQNVAGAYFYGDWPHWKIAAAYFALSNRVLTNSSASDGNFSTGYLQIDRIFNGPWTAFGRIEDSSDVSNNPYLTLFPGFVTSRALLGIRYDVAKNHALTVEAGKVNIGTLNEDYNHLSFQWSALFQ